MSRAEVRRGTWFGLAAYGLWGVFPLYFHLLSPSGALEILGHRVLWSLVLCLIVITAARRWRAVRTILGTPALLWRLTAASIVLAINWGVYVYAVNSGQVVEASLGYYINPLVTVAFGVVLLREKLRPLQWVAIAVGTLAVLVLTLGQGTIPAIALILAGSFATYSLLKKQVGPRVDALSGLTVETMALAAPAAALLAWFGAQGRSTFTATPIQPYLLASAGVVTVAPLLLFAASARRVPLSLVGLMQYLTPTLQLGCGVLILGEHLAGARLAGFALVWVALLALSLDLVRNRT